MKKMLMVLFGALYSICLFSQEHFKFMGIEMSGTKQSFIQALKEKGFAVYGEATDEEVRLIGFYEQYPVELFITATPVSQQVQFVAVSFKESPSWDHVKSLYEELQALYARQLPLEREVRCFQAPYKEGDHKEMEALERRKCLYLTNFKNDQGSILLMISEFHQVVVAYQDARNTELGNKEVLITVR